MISAPLIEYLKKGIFTVLGLILAVYLFIILLTYTGNDPSWSHISSDMTTINNMGGAMGAWFADLLYSFFGFGAWWLLAFLVYESILIWWDNKPTFWLLRLVAYVFLILSGSALFAQLVALVQHVANPVAQGLEGVAGGIIGLELQARLAQLLTAWGSVLFLTVFVIITATFAFNIHWLTVYHKLTNLGWLGSGVKAHDSHLTQSTDDDALVAGAAENTDSKAKNSNTKKSKPDYGQLPLELQPDYQLQTATGASAPDTSGHFSHVLTDFLAKSGLGASVKATMDADAAAELIHIQAMSKNVPSSVPNSANASTRHTVSNANSTDQNINAPIMPARKVEPSFAWNDANTVDDLLSNQYATEQDILVPDANINANTDISAPIYSRPADKAVNDAVDTEATKINSAAAIKETDTPESEAMVSHVDDLADAWLAEHEPVAVEPVEIKVKPQPAPVVAQALSTAPVDLDLEQEVMAPPQDAAPIAAVVISPQDSTPSNTSLSEPTIAADITPTNTPPANPKVVPTAQVVSQVISIAPSKPTMSFAVPDGDASNHIADMMPDDASRVANDAPIMPDIHDDAAFSQRSRAMQTSKYRAHLSPIPEISILDKPDPNREPSYTVAELEQLSELLEIKLQEFNVKAQVVNAIPGPVVTRFEVELAAGIKASKVTGISRDLARSLSMASLRVVEVIPGKPYIGIEVPNKQREMVRLIELLDTEKFKDRKAQISMAMGKDIGGKPIITDLARAPHMLVAGTTGSGKSVLVNAMLLSMLLKYTPSELRLILIDPKQLELANYNDIPHLLTPVVTDMTEAASSLSWCVAEMERRYQLMSLLKVRKLDEFNKKVRAAEQAGTPMTDPLWRPNDNVSISQAPKLKTLPMIVIVADEFADMIMQVGKQAEELITRLAQKSRAAGIHLILATQRPSVDVITGLIKANIPVRAALRVNSKVDSRTILDSGGAEDMLGNGDMLFLGPGQIEPDRVHGAYVSDEEVNRICDAWRERGAPDYIDNMAGNFELSSPSGGSTGSPSGEDDDLYNDAVGFIMETRKVSASSIQRKFSIGYNRAARIVDSMEDAGLVSSMGKSGKRELLM